jgi:dTDP-4-dehydrorhamnose reductase
VSNKNDFILVHFSTEAVFSDNFSGEYSEKDIPCPINIYGYSKYCGDIYVNEIAKKYYIIRLPILFGPNSKKQFFEKMVAKIKIGENLRIADDIFSAPTYSVDVAKEVFNIINNEYKYGLYHLKNNGTASLYEIMMEYVLLKNIDIGFIKKCSYKDFKSLGKKNIRSILKSDKIPEMRNWKIAINEFIKNEKM